MKGRETLVRLPWWRRLAVSDRELAHAVISLGAVAVFLASLFVAARLAMLAGLS